MATQDLIHGSVVSYQAEGMTNGGEYGVLDVDAGPPQLPVMKWPGLNTSFSVDVEEEYEEISHTPAHGASNQLESVRNCLLGEKLPFSLEVYPQKTLHWPLLEFITGSTSTLSDTVDSTSWMKELDGKYSVFTGVMFEDYKVEIPAKGSVKETISGFAGHRAAIADTSPAETEATMNTSRPISWNDIVSIRMGDAPSPTDTIDHCLSDISFGFTSEIQQRLHPESTLSSKICGVRVAARKMFVSLKLTWADQTFIDLVTGSTKQHLKLVIGTTPDATTLEFGGLYWPKYIAKAEAKELVGDTITCITDQHTFTYSTA